MSLLTKILTPFLEVKKWLFGKKDRGDPMDWTWVNDEFYTEQNRKTEKLASLARYIESLSWLEQKAVRHKKNVNRYRNAMKAAMNERLMIETGRMVYDPAFGAWVVKGEK